MTEGVPLDAREWLSPEELAGRRIISTWTLESWRASGRGPAFTRIVGRVRYRVSDVITFEQQGAAA